jgi:PAB-dependent poly(A)-specific ribonuclease subunit 2
LLHGKGRLQYEAFVDDYIVTSEPVIDYLTRYSGIQPGDLDPKVSKHHVTTLKAVYLKLRHLVDCECVFVGHGLAKDFRIISNKLCI